MMTTSEAVRPLSITDRARIAWAGARYDFWLDCRSVRRSHRKELRRELKANLADAALDIGAGNALTNLGSIRTLASDTVRDGQLRSRWLAGLVAALTTFAVAIVVFMVTTLYYSEGVLDAGATDAVTSSLFPFFGSSVTVDASSNGLTWSAETGPVPLIAALVAWILVAKPWRSRRPGVNAVAYPANARKRPAD